MQKFLNSISIMNRIIISFFVLLLITACGGSKKLNQSSWQIAQGVPELTSDDWLSNMIYDKNSGIIYSISNDKSFLYIRLKSSDRLLKSKIILAGATIWIDTTGKRKEDVGIAFPRKMEAGTPTPGMSLGRDPDVDPMQILLRTRSESMELFGWNGTEEWTWQHATNNKNGIIGKMMMDKNQTLFYQITIPISTIYPNSSSLLKDKIFSIGIELNGIETGGGPGQNSMQTIQQRSPDGMPQQGMGRDGMGRNGMGRNNGMNRQPQRVRQNDISAKDRVWVKKIGFAFSE